MIRAREPAQLLFDDLPAACGAEPFGTGNAAEPERINAFVGALRNSLREVQDAYPGLLVRCRTVIARQLRLPEAPADFTAELQNRARRVLEIAVDPTLKSFVVRCADGSLEPDDLLVSLLTQLANKPPAEWADADEDLFEVRCAEVARRFRNMEALLVDRPARDDGADTVLRLAVARRGHAERERVLPLRTGEDAQVDDLCKRMRNALAPDDPPDRVLAALALIAENLLDSSDDSSPERQEP